MKYVGIDVSAHKLNIHIIGDAPSDYEILNKKEDICQFIQEQGLIPSTHKIGCESTGRCHLLSQHLFVNKGFEFRVINPILTNKKITLSIRKKKTDISDAQHIANLIREGNGKAITRTDLNKTKRTILRTRSTLVKHQTAVKILLRDLEKDPEDEQLQQTIEILKQLIEQMEKSITQLEEQSIDKGSDVEVLIQSIPGFATRLSAVVASEIGDFSNFPSATQLTAFIGIDPKVSQSGDSSKNGKITKRGNPFLRSAFYLAAQVARQHDPELKAFYEKKMSEGKHFRVAVVAVARKLCERVYAVVKRGTPYQIHDLGLSFA